MDTKNVIKCVVGIGASAGGLEPLQSIISHLPKELPNIVVVVAQHLSPDYKSMMVELISRKTYLLVKQVENNQHLESGVVYIAPPNSDVVIKEDTFILKRPSEIGAHPNIDLLFSSIASTYKSKACGIILSGTGRDGTKGMMAIKKAGGVTIVQSPETSKYDGMPQSAVNTKIIDHILSPDEIGNNFPELVTKKYITEDSIKDFSISEPPDSFLEILTLLEHRIGIDFTDYKISTLTRRMHKRINEKKFDNEQEYLEYIRKNPEEIDQLFQEILIGVTTFFRNPELFRKAESILEKIIAAKKQGEILRVWIPGCATGEEAYSYAILIYEQLRKQNKSLTCQIFATDIDMKALHKARTGLFPDHAVKDVPKNLLRNYFVKINNGSYELHKDIRKMVLFSRHDVTSNPPFLRLDLISCRNLLIYFNLELQKKVLPLFYYALNPNGYMLLGKSENINQMQNLFRTEDPHLKIFQRKSTDGKQVHLPLFRPTRTRKIITPEKNIIREDLTISEMVKETVYNTYDNPYVVIDDQMDILEINGNVSKYLQFKQGTASLNLMKLINPQLQIEARAVIGKSLNQMKAFSGNIRKFSHDKKNAQYVKITVKPLLYTKPTVPYFLVIFEEINVDDTFFKMGNEVIETAENPRVIELEQELDATKEHMNSLLEELETSNEELQALNEELQASNEELQASNEELETSNEELQATNEELENAYTELRTAHEQIAKQKDDIENSAENLNLLLNNTFIGFILIDSNYKVITYNKIAHEVYLTLFGTDLKENDSLIQVLPDDIFPAFHQHFKKALSGQKVVTEEEIISKRAGIKYYNFNYTPVELEEGEKESRLIAISFTDLTEEIIVRRSIEESEESLRNMIETIPHLVWVASADGFNEFYNSQWFKYTGATYDKLKGFKWLDFIHPEDKNIAKKLWAESLATGKPYEMEYKLRNHKTGEWRWFLCRALPVRNKKKEIIKWFGTCTDIHEQKQLQQQRDEFLAIASHELKTPVTSIKAYGQVLERLFKKKGDLQSAEQIKKMDMQINRLTKLIADLLDVTKIQSGKIVFHEEAFDFNALVEEITDELQLTTEKHHIVKNFGSTEIVHGDKERIGQVLTNLITNAIKYSPDSNEIIVTTKSENGMMTVEVQDYGMGIPKDKMERVFDQFFRVSGPKRSTLPGLGIGLFVASEIIRRQNGKIWVDSEEGKGSTFSFSLPLKKENNGKDKFYK